MKKYIAALATILCISACGCNDIKITENSSIDETSATEALKETEIETEVEDKEDENLINTEEDNASETDAKEENTVETEAEAEEETQKADDNGRQLYEEANLEQVVFEQYEKSCEMQWKYFMNCPYELNYDDAVGEGNNMAYRVIDADLDDILSDYNTVFTSYIIENGEQTRGDRSAEKLQEKYRVSQYGIYCTDGGRGKRKSYDYTEFEFISYEDDILKLNAISFYTNPSGKTETKEAPFTIVEMDGQWKTWDFTLPY